ncbi:DUF6924 domain-containing protein [Streptomyces sp. NPDC054786]
MNIRELTEVQLHALESVGEEWRAHGLATGPADRAEAEAGVADAHRAAGLEPPATFVWLDSPLAGAVGAWIMSGEKPHPRVPGRTWAQVEDQIRAQIPGGAEADLREQGGAQVHDRLWKEILAQVLDRVRTQVEDEVRTQVQDRLSACGIWHRVGDQVRAQLGDHLGSGVHDSVPGQHDAEWLAGYDYFRSHCSVAEAGRLDGIMRVARSAGRWWPFENAVILTERPTVLHRDGQARLHCETGPALVYPDGFAVWAWHGVRLPPEPVRTRPVIDRTDRDFEGEALVVRTDFSDDEEWRAVVELLHQHDGEREVRTHVVDDRAFAEARPDEVVLSTIAGDPGLEVVFLADAATMKGEHALLAVSTRRQDLCEEEQELDREFRLLPPTVNLMHVNLAIGHLDFWEFAYEALISPDHIVRG